MPFEVTVLGSSAATPTSTRNLSAQLVNLLGRFFLIDCGEGTQMQLRKFNVKIQKINYICISHLHGDHYLGLMGLLSTMSLLNRKKELSIFAPKGLESIINLHLKVSFSNLSFPFKIINLQSSKLDKIFEDDAVELWAFPLKHKIPCWGFKLLEKKQPRNILKEMVTKYNISYPDIISIKSGSDYVNQKGEIIKNSVLTKDSHIPRSYAYCSDTKFFAALVNYIQNVDLLYHEATFHSSLSKRSKSTFHSTAKEAGFLAAKGNVKKLLLGHFSSRYKDLNVLKEDAETEFNNVLLSCEGETLKIKKYYL